MLSRIWATSPVYWGLVITFLLILMLTCNSLWIDEESFWYIKDELRVAFIMAILLFWSLTVGRATYKEQPESRREHICKWFSELSHEFAGAMIGALLIYIFVTIPAERRDTKNFINTLVWEMGNTGDLIQLRAVNTLRSEGWLTDGTLRNKDFKFANLIGGNLSEADLQGANLEKAKLIRVVFDHAILRDANLSHADLSGQASLVDVDMQGANCRSIKLNWADLSNVDLRGAKLQRAEMNNVKLQGAKLQGANLQHATMIGAILDGAEFDETTILPDGSNWRSDTDMSQFTDLE